MYLGGEGRGGEGRGGEGRGGEGRGGEGRGGEGRGGEGRGGEGRGGKIITPELLQVGGAHNTLQVSDLRQCFPSSSDHTPQ